MKKVIVGCVLLFATASVFAESVPFQASITPEIALYDQTVMVEGLALSVWGENPQKAIALGIVNGSTGDSAGFTWSWLLNYSDNYKGIQWALVNYARGDFLGWQAAGINYTEGRAKGLQTGWVNYANDFTGLQFGLVNFANTVESGVQLGLLNVIRETETWFQEFPDAVAPGMVILNWRF